ncbi:MAG: DUF58 domain-containing protein [Gemmatimonadetes bacterium]|nr:DUF58 domain-containing protein [Gemmatimonadota bacterium]
MTKAGAAFIGAGVAVYLLGGQTQIGWLYLLDAMIWSLVALSALLPWWSLRQLRIERQVWLPTPMSQQHDQALPVEGGTVEIRLTVTNRGRLPRYFVRVIEESPLDAPEARSKDFLLPTVSARSDVAFSYTAACYRRGRYTSASAVLEVAAPLGLFVRRRRYDLPLKVTVYPESSPMEGVPASADVWADEGKMVRSGAASDFYGSREYQYGDPLRNIHWRNTARLGQFIVKEFEEASQASVAVAFETAREWGVGKETTVEYAIKIAASLARQSGGAGRSIGILAGPAPLLEASLMEAMDYLAGLPVGEGASLDELTAAPEAGRTLVAIVTARDTGLIPILQRLAERERRLVVVLTEGFASGEMPGEFVSRLGGGSIDLVRCSRGDLGAAVAALGRSRLLAA